jgi:ABC-type lipoprotein release transport system permease subunit
VPTFAAVIAMLCLTSALACFLPARRATRIMPTEAIRTDRT